MGTQRMIEFTAVSDDGADRVAEAVATAFRILDEKQPEGVRLAYWRVTGTRRFVALIDLDDEAANPLAELEETRMLPRLIGESVEGGYPRPEVLEPLGCFAFGR